MTRPIQTFNELCEYINSAPGVSLINISIKYLEKQAIMYANPNTIHFADLFSGSIVLCLEGMEPTSEKFIEIWNRLFPDQPNSNKTFARLNKKHFTFTHESVPNKVIFSTAIRFDLSQCPGFLEDEITMIKTQETLDIMLNKKNPGTRIPMYFNPIPNDDEDILLTQLLASKQMPNMSASWREADFN